MFPSSKTTIAAAALAFYSLPSLAQSEGVIFVDGLPGADTQRLQQQRLDASSTNGALGNALDESAQSNDAAVTDLAHLPAQTPCFQIDKVEIANNPFRSLQQVVAPVVGQCVGAAGLKATQDAAANALIGSGYITSRVSVPPQSLAGGTIELEVQPGRVGEVREVREVREGHEDGPSPGNLARALPLRSGDLLDQRGVDQALENLRRLSSQSNARFDIMPGASPGESDIVLYPGDGKRWRAAIGYDNAGQNVTGKNEIYGLLTIDSPLHQYDQLQVSGLTNADRGAPGKGSTQASASYSVPFGYSMLSFDAYRSSYLQTRSTTFGDLQFTGEQKGAGVKLSHVIQRSAHSRTELSARLYRAINHNYMADTLVDVQDRDVYGYELGVSHRHYFGRVQVDASLGWRATLPGLSRAPGYVLDDAGFSGREQIETASVSVLAPFRVANQPFSYQFTWTRQNARTRVTSPDFFTIGTRYAVRGFDQQTTLAAENGWAVSNELDWYAPTSFGVQALYVGLDAGRVNGPSAPYLTGNTLVGTVAGIRGTLAPKNRFAASVNYDVSLGWPLYKPKAFPNRTPTMLVQVTALV
ncbi:ShlB/FhaC/HecB family hemolysin secretion/activation protein [Paraburkholderia bannensis]|uniref:ShlB/FhaC/HecB family hemolysin secretion/activation protein n=1 Tax=Paraburkholderia bannensis TaxID=765414 RepID=UPI002AB679C2|nr:ShlB/FhaC/HecB family hemolysin secretion/activation protein [Paraburkholderia bannensis]